MKNYYGLSWATKNKKGLFTKIRILCRKIMREFARS